MTNSQNLIGNCRIIDLPVVNDERGKLSFLQNTEGLGFEIRRVFWCYNVPAGDERGGHAYRIQHEAILAVSGSFDVEIKMPTATQKIHLNRPNQALIVPAGVWRTMNNFSSNALSAHLSSSVFDESDYIRDWQEFLDDV